MVVRGENYVAVLDGTTYQEKTRIVVANGPGMTIFSPDGKYGYVCSSFTPETAVITVADHKIVGKVQQASPFCPNIAATPDGSQVWFTLKDTGKVQVFDAQPPFALLKTLDTGPITNHVNIVRNANGMFAYVTIGGLNEIQVYRTNDFSKVATIPVGKLPHGIWPSGDGTRVYVGLENEDRIAAIDTLTNKVIATSPIGQAAQAVVYVPNAIPMMSGTRQHRDDDDAGRPGTSRNGEPAAARRRRDCRRSCGWRRRGRSRTRRPPASRSPIRAWCRCWRPAVTGLEPGKPYVLALSNEASGAGALQPLQGFMTNPAGAAVVNAIGPIRQFVRGEDKVAAPLSGDRARHGREPRRASARILIGMRRAFRSEPVALHDHCERRHCSVAVDALPQRAALLTRAEVYALIAVILLRGVQAMAARRIDAAMRTAHGPKDTIWTGSRHQSEGKGHDCTCPHRSRGGSLPQIGLSLRPTRAPWFSAMPRAGHR